MGGKYIFVGKENCIISPGGPRIFYSGSVIAVDVSEALETVMQPCAGRLGTLPAGQYSGCLRLGGFAGTEQQPWLSDWEARLLVPSSSWAGLQAGSPCLHQPMPSLKSQSALTLQIKIVPT